MTKALVIDSSALIALFLEEGDRDRILDSILGARRRLLSAFSLLESGIVAEARKGPAGRALFDELCRSLELLVVALDEEQSRVAREAWRRFGKGRHPASLNIGDCCSYALARISGLPLLCKGQDFPETDLEIVGLSS